MDKRFTEALYNIKELRKRYASIGIEGILGLGIIDKLIKESEEVLKEYEIVKADLAKIEKLVLRTAINYEVFGICDGRNEATSNGWKRAKYCPECGRKLKEQEK